MRPLFRSASLVLVVGALLVLSGCSQTLPLNTLDPAGRPARYIDRLANPVFAVAGLVFLFVNFGVLYVAVKFRRREGEDDVFPEQVHGNTKLEVTWTAIPAAILVLISIGTIVTLFKLTTIPEDRAFTVKVVGQQWWWSYEYDFDSDGTTDLTTATEMVIPVGKPIALKITSNDVIHSFWIPKLNGKKDAVPGRIHDWWIEADKPGYYLGQCTEFCGLSHAYMRMAVDARSESDFDAWVAAQRKPSVEPESAAAKRGLETFSAQCASCHEVDGVNGASCEPLAKGETLEFGKTCYTGLQPWKKAAQVSGNAPNLTHLMSRKRFIGGIEELYNEDGTPAVNTIEAWIRNPSDFKPLAPNPSRGNEFGRGMPKLALTEAQIDDLVAYLTTLK